MSFQSRLLLLKLFCEWLHACVCMGLPSYTCMCVCVCVYIVVVGPWESGMRCMAEHLFPMVF